MYKDYGLVSCICLTYNNIKHFENCLLQFKRQTYKNKKLIVVDNSQYTQKNEYSKNIDDLIIKYKLKKYVVHLIEHKRQHLGTYRNIALDYAYSINSRFIANFDDDDIFNDDRLEKQINFLIENDKKVCLFGNFTMVHNFSKNKIEVKCSMKRENSGLLTSAVIDIKNEYDYDILDRVKYQNISFAEDSNFVVDFIKKYGDVMLCIYDKHDDYVYIGNGTNISGMRHFNQMIDLYKIAD